MSTKSRWSLFGSAHGGARIRLQSATEELAKIQRLADRAKAEEWSYRIPLGGSAQPSPTIAESINGGYEWLQVECRRCRHEAQVPLTEIRLSRDTPI